MKNEQRKMIIKRLEEESKIWTENMKDLEIGSAEYTEVWDKIFKIESMLDEVRKPKPKLKLDKEWIPVVGSLLSILLIMNHEKADVITTKALGFVKKA